MRTYFTTTWISLLILAPLFAAQRHATEGDMVKLQADLRNLEADLANVKVEALPSSERERIVSIQEEVIYLKVKIRKNQEAGEEGTGVPLEEVQALRLEIADLRNDLRGYLILPSSPQSVTLPSGTEITVRLEESLSSATANPGDRFSASTTDPVAQGGAVAIEAGSLFRGRVELVDRTEGRTDRKARLILALDELEMGGTTYDVTATVTKASERLETGIGAEKTKLGVGAGLGTVLGAVLGGKKGAVVGAVVGGTGAILATEGKEVELPRGTILYLRLDRDLVIPLRR